MQLSSKKRIWISNFIMFSWRSMHLFCWIYTWPSERNLRQTTYVDTSLLMSRKKRLICFVKIHKPFNSFLVASAEQRPCSSSPCENAGVCREVTSSDFVCECPKGFSGKVCQHRSRKFPLIFLFQINSYL